MRYYSILRLVGPGTFPSDRKPIVIENFDDKKFCEEIQQNAWGYLEYEEPLTEQQIKDYELVPAGLKQWYCVVTTVHANGRVTSSLVDVVSSVNKPSNVYRPTMRSDIYVEYFDSKELAYLRIAEARNA